MTDVAAGGAGYIKKFAGNDFLRKVWGEVCIYGIIACCIKRCTAFGTDNGYFVRYRHRKILQTRKYVLQMVKYYNYDYSISCNKMQDTHANGGVLAGFIDKVFKKAGTPLSFVVFLF